MIEPALSAEEWISGHIEEPGFIRSGSHAALYPDSVHIIAMDDEGTDVRGGDRHALAALCLHSQPFGFTWADVDLIHSRFDLSDDNWSTDAEKAARSLVDRIAALLPPRSTDA